MANQIILIALSLIGLVLSGYIAYKRTQKQKMVCIIGKDCSKVINSRYGKTFLVPNDIAGIVYYFIILLSTLIFLVYPFLLADFVASTRLVAVTSAFLASVYLTFVQIFVIKEMCEYCLGANLINILIFITLIV